MSEKINQANWQRLDEIFADALELEPAEQAAFLDENCKPDLRAEVEAMLAAVQKADADGFLKQDVFRVGTRILANAENENLLEGKIIGSYRIIREIGRGGMGAVFLAEREEFKQTVALKIIKRGMDTDEIIKRFHREREVLANLNYPNIARLLDGGTTEDGLPYFVMEYVEGTPVTEFCDAQRLGIEERLRLFKKTCSAVSYIHQRSIVHRDIKPSNILVDADGEPKLLDFGIAKLLAPEKAEQTLTQTAAEMRLLTPEYASPEQIRGERVTTASDIYSLGVLLYELLSGHRPLRLKNVSPHEILKIVSEQEPTAPSTAALTTEEIARDENTKEILSPETIAEFRRESPERLQRHLRGDLDNITLKALRKEPKQRYATVEQLAEDIRRHLEGLPVSARPATAAYRAAKFIRRNQTATMFATLLAVLIIAIAVLSFGYWFSGNRSTNIESIAVLPFQNESGNADIEYLSDGMTETLISSLSQLPKLNVKARSSVFRYKGKETDAQTVGKELNVQAILTGRVVQRGNNLALHIELVDAASENVLWSADYNSPMANLVSLQNEIARDVSRNLKMKLSGADEQRLAKNYTENAEAYRLYLKGRFHWDKRTVKDLQKSIEYFQQAIEVDPNYALAYAGLADAYAVFANFGGALPREVMPKAREAALKALSLDDQLAEAHASLGYILICYDYNFAEGEREFKRAIELNPNYASVRHWYGNLLTCLGRYEEASAEFRRALEIEPFSFIINRMYAENLTYARKYDEAVAQLKKTLELDANFVPTHNSFATVYQLKGSYAESVEEYAKAEELSGNQENAVLIRESFAKGGWEGYLRAMLGARRQFNLSPYNVATIYAQLGEKEQALAELNKAYEERRWSLILLKAEPRLDPLRDDPRFQDLLRRVGLPN